jgi:Protein of unknown function (DUF551)
MSAIPDHAEIYRKLHANRYEHVEQARRARDMQAQTREWLPIDTYPYGFYRNVILFDPHPGIWVCIGCQVETDEGTVSWEGHDLESVGPVHPTHWMPLPEPPSAQSDT